MTLFKLSYDSLDDLPETINPRELFTERDGKFHFSAIQDLRSKEDVEKLQGALNKERNDHASVKETLGTWTGLGESPDDVQKLLQRIPELEIAAEGKFDEGKFEESLNKRVEGQLKGRMAPLERELDNLKKERESLQQANQQFAAADKERKIVDSVRKAAVSAKVHEGNIDDCLEIARRVFDISEDGNIVTKENVGCTPYSNPESWLAELQQAGRRWWKESVGSGAKGSGNKGGFNNNPWAKETWNLTEQGKIFKENPDLANQMKSSAGVK